MNSLRKIIEKLKNVDISNWIKQNFGLYSVRKKVFLLSKLSGALIILFYLVVEEFSINSKLEFWIWFIILVIFIMSIDFLLGKFISEPITSINKSAKSMSQLDFSNPCTVNTNDEFGELSRSLNTMSTNLQQALSDLESANIQLEKDVNNERMLLEQRKELVDTISHEMKTPLGIIRAYTEGLMDEVDEEKKKNYMNVIIEETDRMNNMIVSLLDLSALEAGVSKLNPERFDFIEFVETVAGRLLIDIPDANFYFTYDLPEYEVFVVADKMRMEQVVENLVINAKKHVVYNGNLDLSITCENGLLLFEIYNDGRFIEQDEISKIWSKFYRSVQSQRTGGSGLGLAIVSQILTMQGLEYGVNNRDRGVEFYFMIPIDE
ncbi:Alkaline phosphatase synthesis sensor protein phoR [Clostridioides difficile]|uniref:sensor histidine kinase n=1 Tax=Clostridioides difficile TaxID=1496 RepID=UPI0003B29E6C|nr:HAMP domain-containing sensor histidine kinase [Clostridioides difficile]CCL12612.1 Two-component sensor histidine kinase [Clostridioides difficile E16]CCL96950.1 Two-component sensor histidine kinase [Clostridioides difficile T61]SJN82870.1 Alkaline phosphatase synthesis sensor protein phoR [Clostridioides difficile]SJO63219.1 Alkaline phosphatase synthesis sensor protein phoR [Clostridioides difficile]SJO69903.1 Alkaline phosphatase synthesis sensor protein phoR [Clostridioides difficile]